MKELPAFDAFALPVLAFLAKQPDGARKSEIREALIAELGIGPELLAIRLPSKDQSTFDNRVGWACSWMKNCGWTENPLRNNWRISDAGRKRLALGTSITAAEMRRIIGNEAGDTVLPALVSPPTELPARLTPNERIEEALKEIRAEVEQNLLERLGQASPGFFERAVLKLLKQMGYPGLLGAAEHSGRTADGGIDGILYLDRLQLERVYVQAKRWKEPVGASIVRDFAGAMDGEAATKGIIMTTSAFTKEARKYVEKSPKAIRLVEGQEIAQLMIEFGVGVSRANAVVLPKIDEDFFDEE